MGLLSHGGQDSTILLHGIVLFRLILLFLGAFAKLEKVTVSFVMSVGRSVRIEQPGSGWTDLYEI